MTGTVPQGWVTLSGGTMMQAVPAWYDVDFARLPGGRLVAACCPYNPDSSETYGQLQVWQWDDGTDPEATTSVTLEPGGVVCCSLLALPDNVLDLWYCKRADWTKPWQRRSRDGGLTWSAATQYLPGISSITSPSAGSLAGQKFVPMAYNEASQLLVMAFGARGDNATAPEPGAGTPAGTWLYTGRFDPSGDWDMNPVRRVQEFDAYGGHSVLFHDLHPLGDGSFAALPSMFRFSSFRPDGSFTVDRPFASSATSLLVDTSYAAAFDASRQLCLNPDGGSAYEWGAVRKSGGGTGWTDGWSLANSSGHQARIQGWNPTIPGTATHYHTAASAIRRRGDGVFEFLRPTSDGNLRFARCRQVQADANATATWEGTV